MREFTDYTSSSRGTQSNALSILFHSINCLVAYQALQDRHDVLDVPKFVMKCQRVCLLSETTCAHASCPAVHMAKAPEEGTVSRLGPLKN